MVTIKQLAELCGVSRGTVDRVLNNRGNVKPEKRDLILATAKKLNYRPDPAGKALIARKKKPTVGIILPSEGIRFFDDVITAMKQAEERYSLFGLQVIWRLMRGYDVERQVQLLDELHDKVNALIIDPINQPAIVKKIGKYIADGILVVTLNNDVEKAQHHYYIGPDYLNGGETAGGILHMIVRGPCRVGVALGSRSVLGHRQRLEGFTSVLKQDPASRIVGIIEDNDDDIYSYERMKQLLVSYPEINALFLASSGGSYGACRAVTALHREKTVTIVAFDTIPTTIDMMKRGVIDVAIYQHPRQQGSVAMRTVYDFLFNGIRPEKPRRIMSNEIRILQNALPPADHVSEAHETDENGESDHPGPR